MNPIHGQDSGPGPGIELGVASSRPPGVASRWITYFSPERRVLWSECQGNGAFASRTADSGGSLPPYKDAVPGARHWQSLVDAVFATRIPQCGTRRLPVDGRERDFVFKAFPDFGVNGKLRGVVQLVEKLAERPADAIVERPHQVNSLLDLSLGGMALYDPPEDRLVEVNRRLAQETGYAVRELTGMPGRALFGGEGAALLLNLYNRMVAAGESMIWGQVLSLYNRRGDGESYFASLRVAPGESSRSGKPLMQMSLVVADIDRGTGRLREGPSPHFVSEALSDGLWEYDLRLRVFRYSSSFRDIFGPDGLPGGPGKRMDEWVESIYQAEPEKIFHKWRQLVKNGVRYRVEYRIRDLSGQWRWIMSTIHAVLNDADGRPARVVGFHADITEAVASDRRQAGMEERLRLVFENSGLGIALCNLDGSIERVNPALAVMLGRNRDDFEGGWMHPFADADSQAVMIASLERLYHGGRREHMTDLRFVREDGREVWVNITATLSCEDSIGSRYMILMVEDVTAGRASRERLWYEATHDAMTGAWSRGVLLERLGQYATLAVRHGLPLTFCICDLDHFKRVNDMYGHQAGDRVLARFVEILKETVRETDVVGRYGGEEFGVVFPNTAPDGAAHSMERALELMRREEFVDGAGGVFTVTATFGVAEARPDDGMKQLIARADAALYEGKQNGRDRVVTAR